MEKHFFFFNIMIIYRLVADLGGLLSSCHPSFYSAGVGHANNGISSTCFGFELNLQLQQLLDRCINIGLGGLGTLQVPHLGPLDKYIVFCKS